MQVLSGGGGNFLISGLYDPSFGIRITMNGYKSYYKNFSIPVAIKVFSLAPIVLQIDYEELQAVVVRQVQPITIKRDTLEYYAGAYSVREGSMLAELMKKLPGVAVNDSVTVMGKKISKVLLDGKLFFGGDVKAALKNLPYDIIDKVEMIDDYGDQARLTGVRTGEPKKILNIVLKQDKRNGQIGNMTGGRGNKGQNIASLSTAGSKADRKLSLTWGIPNIKSKV